MHAKFFNHVRFFATPWTVACQASLSILAWTGIFQAGILEWVAIPFSRGLPNPGTKPMFLMSPALADGFFTISATWVWALLINAVRNHKKTQNFQIFAL